MPLFEDAKDTYFDSLLHSSAVVAINTTGMIEAGIVGRASFTLLTPEFAETQHGTLHFAHLTSPGFVRTATSYEEHHAQLDAELKTPSTRATLAPFIQHFVRPHGISVPATPFVADTIERLAGTRTAGEPDPLTARLLRPVLSWLI